MDQQHIERRHISPDDYDIPDELATGVYSNVALVLSSGPQGALEEVTLDFLYAGKGLPHPRLVARVILSPRHATRLYKALGDNLKSLLEKGE
jgi:hypothetical protein